MPTDLLDLRRRLFLRVEEEILCDFAWTRRMVEGRLFDEDDVDPLVVYSVKTEIPKVMDLWAEVYSFIDREAEKELFSSIASTEEEEVAEEVLLEFLWHYINFEVTSVPFIPGDWTDFPRPETL